MNESRSGSQVLPCRDVGRVLRVHAGDPAPGRDAELPSLDAVRMHLRDCPRCQRRHHRRLADLEVRQALRDREPPAGTLDGLYEDIRARSPYATPGGGMSSAFLDAPRTLRLWRTTAMAASLLLAVGAGFVISGGAAEEGAGGGVRPLGDPRDRLLEAFEPVRVMPEERLRVRPFRVPMARGHEGFFGPVGTQPVDHEDGNGREVRLR